MATYMTCEICGKEYCVSSGRFTIHLEKEHNLTAQEYYDKFLKKDKSEGICPVCGKFTKFYSFTRGYAKCCSPKCSTNFSEVKGKIKQTCLEKYGTEYPWQAEEIKEKMKQTWCKKYGVEHPTQAKIIKQKVKQTCLEKFGAENPYQSKKVKEKIKQTCLERYGVEYTSQSESCKEKVKQTCIERYGNPTYNNIEKARETVRKNNSYGLSKPEERTFEKLVEIFENVDREHREDRYPFSCDFYIPERDMFIEYNGFWTHHTHFYDETSEEDRNQVKLWESKREKSSWYEAAINNWTISDIKKRNTARDNNLNYVVFWNEDDVDKWIADGCPDRRDYA